MATLHIVPGNSAGGSLNEALRQANLNDKVLAFPDDLSCGPIDSDEPSARAAWWETLLEPNAREEARLRAFWDRIESTSQELVVWFGRHDARELAFYLNLAHRLGDRPYYAVDVTGLQRPSKAPDGTLTLSSPARSVSTLPADALRSLLRTERLVSRLEKEANAERWQLLQKENAPFRIVTEQGLASTTNDFFDRRIMALAQAEWQNVNRIVGNAMVYESDPYFQTGDLILYQRVTALVANRQLLEQGNSSDYASWRVRLPEK